VWGDGISGQSGPAARRPHHDAGDVWTDEETGIALGHRRLSIVDLTPAGAQPMHSSDGRWVVIYNGELYNTEDLRAEVTGTGHSVNWRGHSDTEVILEAVSIWGVERAVAKFNGIFALALACSRPHGGQAALLVADRRRHISVRF
jgi:asparagine synthase (glutamine-hydrolysing)